MRWIRKVDPMPERGARRIVRRFAWRRTKIGPHTVWLEWYEVLERYYSPVCGGKGWWNEIDRSLT